MSRFLGCCLLPAIAPAFLFPASLPTKTAARNYGRLPLAFEANRGQFDPSVKFLARGEGYTLSLTAHEVVLSFAGASQDERVTMKFPGANPDPVLQPLDRLPGKTNYFVGEPSRWRAGVPNYAKVAYRNLYPGIAAVFYGNQRQMEYDLVVEPGYDPNAVRIDFDGFKDIRVDDGDLLMTTPAGELRQRKPVIYQERSGRRRRIEGRYVLLGRSSVRVEVASYDRNLPLNIDPVLIYSTYLGGSGGGAGGNDTGRCIATDAAGNTYIAGATESTGFPVSGAALAGAYRGGSTDAFVTKLDPNGALVYSTYLGAAGADEIRGIAVDSAGNAYLTGFTTSSQFPTSAGAFQTTWRGGYDAFVVRLGPTGSTIIYSTLLGGTGDDQANAIKVNTAGEAYVAGQTVSPGFPVSPGSFQSSPRYGADAFVTKLKADGSGLVYSTLLGGNNDDIATALALDSTGLAYVAGKTASADFPVTSSAARKTVQFEDGFVAKINAEGSALVYSTLVGGNSSDNVRGIVVDSAGRATVTGSTASGDLPVTKSSAVPPFTGGALDPIRILLEALRAYRFQNLSGSLDGFVLGVSSDGSAFQGGVYLGGRNNDTANAIALASSGFVVVAGETESSDLLVSADARQGYYGGGNADTFVAKLKAEDLSIVYFSYFGGSGEDRAYGVAVDESDGISLTGMTTSANFPTTPGALRGSQPGGGSDAFVAKLSTDGSNLIFSTFLGGAGTATTEEGIDICADVAGNAYITGATASIDFPVTDGAMQPWYRGGRSTDVFVTKLDPTGRHFLYSTYLGGIGEDTGSGIAVDTAGNAYVTGVAQSLFPVTPGAFQTQLRGNFDVFLAKLTPDGSSLVFSTYLGGSRDEGIERRFPRVALDGSGLPVVAGTTESTNFPTTPGAFQATIAGQRDVFVTKFKADGGGLIYSTYFGGDEQDDLYGLAVDASGQAYIAGVTNSALRYPTTPGAYRTSYGGISDGFVAKLNATGSGLVYSTYLGGASGDGVYRLAVDPAGAAYAVGVTASTNFPATQGSGFAGSATRTAFVTKINPAGSGLEFSNRFTEVTTEYLDWGIALDPAGGILVSGQTSLQGLPVTDDAPQVAADAAPDGFLLRFAPNGTTVTYGSYLAGGGADRAVSVAVDNAGNAYVTGQTGSANFLTTSGVVQPGLGGPRNAFVTKIDLTRTLPVERPVIAGVTNYGSGKATLAPGAIISIAGERLAKETVEAGKPLDTRSTALPTRLGNVTVSIPGRNLPLFSVSPTRIVAQLPYAAATGAGTYLSVAVEGVSSRPVQLDIAGMAIGILAVYKTDLSLNSATNKLTAGDTMIVYVTGAGRTNPSVSSGAPAPSSPVGIVEKPERILMMKPENPMQGADGELKSLTLMPGLVGVAQAQILIPSQAEPGAGDQFDLHIGWRNVDSNKYRIYVVGTID